jgi:hypothetical protein
MPQPLVIHREIPKIVSVYNVRLIEGFLVRVQMGERRAVAAKTVAALNFFPQQDIALLLYACPSNRSVFHGFDWSKIRTLSTGVGVENA